LRGDAHKTIELDGSSTQSDHAIAVAEINLQSWSSASVHRERSDLSKIRGVVAAQYPENLCFSPSNNLRFSSVEVLTGLKTGSSGKSKRGNNHMKAMLSTFLRDESGATAIEYGLIAVGIAIAIIATVNGIGSGLSSTFTSVSTSLK
jgi:pilus assembly protein Flp/PilA